MSTARTVTETMSRWGELQQAATRAQASLSDMACKVLIENKFVVKSFTFDMQFFPHMYRLASIKLLQILGREFLKRNPIFKVTKMVRITSRAVTMELSLPKEVIERYLAMIRRRSVLAGLESVIYANISQERVYVYDPLGNENRVTITKLNVFMGAGMYGENNPYRIFQHLEDIIKIVETLSKYTRLEFRSNSSEIVPFYLNKLKGVENGAAVVPA